MADYKVAIDAGHGGNDFGAVFNGRQEKDDVFRLAMEVGRILENSGIDVFYVRDDDIYETPFKKASDANNSGADLLVSLHRNSSESPNQYSGVETLVYEKGGTRSRLASNINAELERAGFRNLGVNERPNLVVLRRSQMPAALVEVGFINNENDNRIFDQNFNAIAKGIADGILTTLYQGSSATSGSSVSAVNKSNINTAEENVQEMVTEISEENNLSENVPNNTVLNENMPNENDFNRNNSDENDFNRNNSNENNFNGNDRVLPNGSYTRWECDDDESGSDNSVERLYRVQVGAFRNKESADRMLNSLLIEGFPAFIVYDDGIYKVQVGAFRFLANAIKMEERLRRFRYNTYITT